MKTRRIGMSLFGVIICAISVGIFKIAALGVDPFQSLMSGLDKLIPIGFGTLYVIVNLILLTFALIITNTWKIGKFQYIRIITDLICVILGGTIFVIGGGSVKEIPTIIGAGTIITAFFMGPLIEFFNAKIARPFLNKGQKAESKENG